ncbi:EAL domain-containing protein [Clostridium intestinale]|uniref:EAL domain-containing protein n=1 Tax=Clostridium intestinale TaxID=36845 RepID=UPI002DD65C37|nr:EAL domain-containing protein [Clostridium intestinale]WRY50517.1 EAL domain-containing protein [Clostridium intestinale]
MVKHDKIKKNKKYQLRSQISIFFLLTIVASVLIVYGLSNKFIIRNFDYLLKNQGQGNIKQVVNELNNQLIDLENSAKDYGSWDDTYEYVLNRDKSYIDSNYIDETFSLNNWNLLYIFDKDKKLAYGKEFDLHDKQEINKSDEVVDFIKGKEWIFNDIRIQAKLISSPKGSMLLAAYPITRSGGLGNSVGWIVCGRYVNENLVNSMGDNLLMNLKLDDNIDKPGDITSTTYISGRGIKADIWVDKNGKSDKSVGIIYDYDGNKLIKMSSNIDVDMNILNMGTYGVYKYIATTSVVLLVSFILLLWLIDKTIFKRLNELIYNVGNIEKNNDFSKRISIKRNDEISILETGFNNLLSTVERTQSEILYQAKYDQLTETFNRGVFFDDVQVILDDEMKNGNKSAIIFIDIDGFKDINDSLGHSTGDYILVNVAARLKEKLKNYNPIISRFGGDEFVTFIPNIKSYKEIDNICKDLLDRIKQPMYIGRKACKITCSIGISISIDHGSTVDDLINNADVAMYHVKKNNKNNSIIYNEDMRSRISQEMLEEALDNNEFVLYYQKQVDITTERIEGAEALVRWNSADRGFVSPIEFIPLAEETGFIVPLGKWILEEACKQCKEWNDTIDKDFRVSVNVSSIQFMEKAFIDMVVNTLKTTGINPKNLELEITESVALYKEEEVISKLEELKNLGVRVSIDDFGTGYSSLKYLQKFKIDGLKIDKAFIDNINENSSIAKSIISMAENLGVYVIAEGVETVEQVNCLRSLKCQYIQGYYYGKPVPPDGFDLKIS